jgi:hypothetical protein
MSSQAKQQILTVAGSFSPNTGPGAATGGEFDHDEDSSVEDEDEEGEIEIGSEHESEGEGPARPAKTGVLV